MGFNSVIFLVVLFFSIMLNVPIVLSSVVLCVKLCLFFSLILSMNHYFLFSIFLQLQMYSMSFLMPLFQIQANFLRLLLIISRFHSNMLLLVWSVSYLISFCRNCYNTWHLLRKLETVYIQRVRGRAVVGETEVSLAVRSGTIWPSMDRHFASDRNK